MSSPLLLLTALLALANLVVVLVLLFRRRPEQDSAVRLETLLAQLGAASERLEREMRDELSRARTAIDDGQRNLGEGVDRQLARQSEVQRERLEKLAVEVASFSARQSDDGGKLRKELSDSGSEMQKAISSRLGESSQEQSARLASFDARLDSFGQRLTTLTAALEARLGEVRNAVEERLSTIASENAKKLDEMRQTVDERLQSTLEKRLGDSFQLVSKQLQDVHAGLGEMKNLAGDVGSLQRVLTNVKTRGTFGEYQLSSILEQYFTPSQYRSNVETVSGSGERVEFAIVLPRRDSDGEVLLPVDSKFPIEDYHRLVEAESAGDAKAVEEAGKALERQILAEAKKIRDKYVASPRTTDFAVLFLPFESLYVEVLRRVGLFERIHRDLRVVVCGPTTLSAFLSSVHVQLKALAIERRSSEIWDTLGAVRSEFGKFGESLAKVRKKLQEATNQVDDVDKRARVMTSKLKRVDQIDDGAAQRMLELSAGEELEDVETPV